MLSVEAAWLSRGRSIVAAAGYCRYRQKTIAEQHHDWLREVILWLKVCAHSLSTILYLLFYLTLHEMSVTNHCYSCNEVHFALCTLYFAPCLIFTIFFKPKQGI